MARKKACYKVCLAGLFVFSLLFCERVRDIGHIHECLVPCCCGLLEAGAGYPAGHVLEEGEDIYHPSAWQCGFTELLHGFINQIHKEIFVERLNGVVIDYLENQLASFSLEMLSQSSSIILLDTPQKATNSRLLNFAISLHRRLRAKLLMRILSV
jgi:hypothetical protein